MLTHDKDICSIHHQRSYEKLRILTLKDIRSITTQKGTQGQYFLFYIYSQGFCKIKLLIQSILIFHVSLEDISCITKCIFLIEGQFSPVSSDTDPDLGETVGRLDKPFQAALQLPWQHLVP